MKNYAFYIPSGEIVVTCTLQDEIYPEAISELPYVESAAWMLSTDDHWIGAGGIVNDYSPTGKIAKRNHPGPGFEWDPLNETWIDNRTLAEVKAIKNSQINAARLRANQSHFTFAGKDIAVDPLSRSDIDAAHGAILMLQALPPGWPGAWKAMDNTYVTISDVATWGAFYGTMVATGTAHFTHSQELKADLVAATTIEEVLAIPSW